MFSTYQLSLEIPHLLIKIMNLLQFVSIAVYLNNCFYSGLALSGVIWSKYEREFVPISEVQTFAQAQQDVLQKMRALEQHDFNGEKLRVIYYYNVTHIILLICLIRLLTL